MSSLYLTDMSDDSENHTDSSEDLKNDHLERLLRAPSMIGALSINMSDSSENVNDVSENMSDDSEDMSEAAAPPTPLAGR